MRLRPLWAADIPSLNVRYCDERAFPSQRLIGQILTLGRYWASSAPKGYPALDPLVVSLGVKSGQAASADRCRSWRRHTPSSARVEAQAEPIALNPANACSINVASFRKEIGRASCRDT